MKVQSDYFNAYHNLNLTRGDKGVLVAEFHTDGLKERIVREVGYGLSLEGASSADLVKSMRAKSEPVAQKGKVA